MNDGGATVARSELSCYLKATFESNSWGEDFTETCFCEEHTLDEAFACVFLILMDGAFQLCSCGTSA